MISRPLKRALKPLASVARKAGYFFVDVFESAFGLRDELTPPRSKIFIGNGDFKMIGDEFLQHFIGKAGLKPADKILDVGCGIGRMAVPLTRYVKEGSYEGIDIVSDGIDWCTKKITPKFPAFKFQQADVHSERYNPKGKYKASEYKFPFEDESFDFVFLTSVFTHMLPQDVDNYLSEISRVLKRDGKCLITYFLLNQESKEQIRQKRGLYSFQHALGDCKVEHDDLPEDAVAFEEDYVRNLHGKHGLNVVDPIHYGSWCGRSAFLSFQDIVVAAKN